MSSDREDGEGRRDPGPAEEAEAPRSSSDEVGEGSEGGGPADAEEQLDPPDGPITLDRYLSRRRPPVRPAWVQIFSLVAMITALVLILIYKDRCAGSISNFMGTMNPQTGSGTGRHIPVHYQQDQTKP